MAKTFEPVQLAKDLFFVGAFHAGLRVFDTMMPTPNGTSYNSYILKGEKANVLVETVNELLYEDLLTKIDKVMKPGEKIDYIIHNHTEPDHGGSSYLLVKDRYPDAKIIATEVGVKILKDIGKENFAKTEFLVSTEVKKLDLGNYTLHFHAAPMLHWPDSMFTYCPELKSIFTCDAFGTHYCYEPLWLSKMEETSKTWTEYVNSYEFYYQCVMSPFEKAVLHGVEVMRKCKKEGGLEKIYTGHGPIVDKHVDQQVDLYEKWANNAVEERKKKFKDGVTIVLVSAYNYTEQMAHEIAKGIESAGLPVKIYDAVTVPQEEILKAINTYRGILLGTPTIGLDALPQIWEIAIKLSPTVNKYMVGGCFGSFGWEGEGIHNINERMKMVKMPLPLEPMTVKFRPSQQELEKCVAWGKKFAEHVKEGK